MAGGRRWWPGVAGDGRRRRPRFQAQGKNGSASVVKMGKMEFCKRGFGERSNNLLERALRGEEDDMVRGGQGGVGGGGNDGEVGGENGLFGGKRGEEGGVVVVLWLLLLLE